MSISNRLEKHFALCAAAVATVAVVSTTNAAVVYSGLVNTPIPFNFEGIYLNVETGATATLGTLLTGFDVNPHGTSTTSVALFANTGTGYMRNPGTTLTNRTQLGLGTTIGSAAFFYGSSSAVIGASTGQWSANATGYFGFRFTAADALTHYGWMRLAIGANASSRTIVDYAYESVAGVPITIIPAPGALALLGLAALATRRRRA